MYRFALRPRWILSHLLVATLVGLMVTAGFWQLRRLDERRDHNAAVEAAAELPSEPIGQLLPAGADATDDDVDRIVYRQTELEGRYELDEQVLVRNRSQDGVPGYWVITPLVLDDGEAVAVNRGWVPFNTTDPDGNWDQFAPPSGPVSVTGLVREGQVRSSGLIGGPTDAEQGRLTTLSRVDLDRLQAQVGGQLFPVYVDLTSQAPPQGDLPVPVPEPELGEGNHLSYAGQWFIFAALTLLVYPLVLRRTARSRAAADPGGGDGSGDPPGGGQPRLDRAVPGRVTSVP